MLKNNCQCELCRSVWGAGAREGESVTAEDIRPTTKRAPVVGSGLTTQVVALVLLICGFVFIAGKLPDGMWYTWPGAVLLAALATLPAASVGVTILNTLEKLYENH